LTALQVIPVPAAAVESEASRLHTATEELRGAIKHAATLIPVEATLDASQEIGPFVGDVVERFCPLPSRLMNGSLPKMFSASVVAVLLRI
jgi:hypothetical protein